MNFKIFRKNVNFRKLTKFTEFTLVIILVIIPQKWQFRFENQNFEISHNAALLCNFRLKFHFSDEISLKYSQNFHMNLQIIRIRIVTTPSKNQSYGNTTPNEEMDEVNMNATHECNISSFYKTANWFIKNSFFIKARWHLTFWYMTLWQLTFWHLTFFIWHLDIWHIDIWHFAWLISWVMNKMSDIVNTVFQIHKEYRGGPNMPAITISLGTKYACNLGSKGD